MQINWKKISTDRKNKCHQVKRKNYHRIEIKVSFDRKYVSTSRKYVSTSRKSAATNRKNVSTDRKNTYQPVEKKVATERKQKSANWTKKGIIRSKWKIRLVVPILLRKFPTDRQIFFRSDDTLFRSADTSTRWHFDSKTLLPENTSTRWVSTKIRAKNMLENISTNGVRGFLSYPMADCVDSWSLSARGYTIRTRPPRPRDVHSSNVLLVKMGKA